jgi:hypothetical protein
MDVHLDKERAGDAAEVQNQVPQSPQLPQPEDGDDR